MPTETEEQLIQRAQQALSQSNWTVGECAAVWTKRYAKGRTDADFAVLIGLSPDQVFQRRRVWETFSDVHQNYAHLKWSHFYAALTWDDAAECLQWADEMQSTVSGMKAWRRAQRGEELDSQEVELPPFDPTGSYLPVGSAMVRDPDEFEGSSGPRGERSWSDAERANTAMTVPRDSEPYAPFSKDARGGAAVAEEDRPARVEPSTEQVFRRIISTLEKCDAAMTPESLEDFFSLPIKLQQRMTNAVNSLSSKIAGLQ